MGKAEFLKYLQYEKRYSQNTLKSYDSDMQQFIAFCEASLGSFEPELINERQVRAWVVDLSKNEISPRSINRKITTLRVFFKFLKRVGFVTLNPVEKFSRLKQKKELPWFVEESAMEKLFEETVEDGDFEGLRNRIIIELFYATGIRLSELINSKIQDIDFQNATLKVLGKRNKERIVPLYETITVRLKQYIVERNKQSSESDYLFLTAKGKKVYEKLVYRLVNKYLGKVTTMEKRSPHVLRHTFATHMLNNGADLNSVKEILGHSSLSATQVYTHNTFEKLRDVYKQAHPRD
jgi:integrase/recombinase XerC